MSELPQGLKEMCYQAVDRSGILLMGVSMSVRTHIVDTTLKTLPLTEMLDALRDSEAKIAELALVHCGRKCGACTITVTCHTYEVRQRIRTALKKVGVSTP